MTRSGLNEFDAGVGQTAERPPVGDGTEDGVLGQAGECPPLLDCKTAEAMCVKVESGVRYSWGQTKFVFIFKIYEPAK